MTAKKKPKSYFTEGEKLAIETLPELEQAAYYRRLGEIAMRIKIADDAWEKESTQITEDLQKLCDEIHERVKGL